MANVNVVHSIRHILFTTSEKNRKKLNCCNVKLGKKKNEIGITLNYLCNGKLLCVVTWICLFVFAKRVCSEASFVYIYIIRIW